MNQPIEIGRTYLVRKRGRTVPVKIESATPLGGWQGRNLITDRSVRIVHPAQVLRPKPRHWFDWESLHIDVGGEG